MSCCAGVACSEQTSFAKFQGTRYGDASKTIYKLYIQGKMYEYIKLRRKSNQSKNFIRLDLGNERSKDVGN